MELFALVRESVVGERLIHEVEMTLVCDEGGADVSGARCGDRVERRVHSLSRERGQVDELDRQVTLAIAVPLTCRSGGWVKAL